MPGIKFIISPLIAILLLTFLSACATSYIRTVKGELQVESKMSDSIFFDPVAPADRKVFVDVRNTSGNSDLTAVSGEVMGAVVARGYQVVSDPGEAQILLQINLLSLERTSIDGAKSALDSGYGGINTAMGTTVAGGVLGSTLVDNDSPARGLAILGGAALGGLIGSAVDANTQDVTYALVTDIRISTREKEDLVYKGSQASQQGSGGSEVVKYTKKRPWMRYSTRVVTTANKVNLELEEAIPAMRSDLASTLGGLI